MTGPPLKGVSAAVAVAVAGAGSGMLCAWTGVGLFQLLLLWWCDGGAEAMLALPPAGVSGW